MMPMRFSVDEILNEAIMSATPTIIVEGLDDVQTYDLIAHDARDPVEIYAVENIDDFSAGCHNVIAAIQKLDELGESRYPVENFILGIIDRDVREFRNELPSHPALLVLTVYSLETHFVTAEFLQDAIQRYTSVTSKLIGPVKLSQIMDTIESALLDYYYFSLESLKYSLHKEYDAAFQYSYSGERRNDALARKQVVSKMTELDRFAADHQIGRDIQSLRKIAKGKWLLETFCREIHVALKQPHLICGDNDFKQCQFCSSGTPQQCLYKLKDGIGHKTIYVMGKSNVKLSSSLSDLGIVGCKTTRTAHISPAFWSISRY